MLRHAYHDSKWLVTFECHACKVRLRLLCQAHSEDDAWLQTANGCNLMPHPVGKHGASRTAEQVGEHGARRLVASVTAEAAAGAAHEQRGAAAVEAPEAARREVLLATAVAEVHKQLVLLQRRRQLCGRRHRARHTLHRTARDTALLHENQVSASDCPNTEPSHDHHQVRTVDAAAVTAR